MYEPKVSLTLTLQGGIMVSQQVAENKPEELYTEKSINIKSYRGKNKEPLTFKIRNTIPVKQVLKMSWNSYKDMLETPTNPKYNKIVAKNKKGVIRVWDTMSEFNRIKKHCELIAHDMKAIDFTFNILSD